MDRNMAILLRRHLLLRLRLAVPRRIQRQPPARKDSSSANAVSRAGVRFSLPVHHDFATRGDTVAVAGMIPFLGNSAADRNTFTWCGPCISAPLGCPPAILTVPRNGSGMIFMLPQRCSGSLLSLQVGELHQLVGRRRLCHERLLELVCAWPHHIFIENLLAELRCDLTSLPASTQGDLQPSRLGIPHRKHHRFRYASSSSLNTTSCAECYKRVMAFRYGIQLHFSLTSPLCFPIRSYLFAPWSATSMSEVRQLRQVSSAELTDCRHWRFDVLHCWPPIVHPDVPSALHEPQGVKHCFLPCISQHMSTAGSPAFSSLHILVAAHYVACGERCHLHTL